MLSAGPGDFRQLGHQVFNAGSRIFGQQNSCLAHLPDLINCQAQPGGLRDRCNGGFTRISIFDYLGSDARQAVGGLAADIPDAIAWLYALPVSAPDSSYRQKPHTGYQRSNPEGGRGYKPASVFA
jgi:hypothetical protein